MPNTRLSLSSLFSSQHKNIIINIFPALRVSPVVEMQSSARSALASFVAGLVDARVADVPAGTGAFAPASPSDAAAAVVSSVASFEDGVEIVALQNLSALTESAS